MNILLSQIAKRKTQKDIQLCKAELAKREEALRCKEAELKQREEAVILKERHLAGTLLKGLNLFVILLMQQWREN